MTKALKPASHGYLSINADLSIAKGWPLSTYIFKSHKLYAMFSLCICNCTVKSLVLVKFSYYVKMQRCTPCDCADKLGSTAAE
jgi:hypothetical protein